MHERTANTIADLEHDLENALDRLRELDAHGELAPELKPLLLLAPIDGTSVHVSLRHRDKARQIRRTYNANAFSQAASGVWIVFEPAHADWQDDRSGGGNDGDPMVELVRALAQAESEPQLSFVSLKWFRDTYLPKRGPGWGSDPDLARRLLQRATENGIVLTSKVANPKTPEFPVTTILLDRTHPMVRRWIGEDDGQGSRSSNQ